MRLLLALLLINFVIAKKEKSTEKLKEEKKSKDLSNGFRSEIDWVEFDKAIGIAKDLNKPIFFLIHKTWCGACKGLKKEFNKSPDVGKLIELSKRFVMVNVEDDEEPEDSKFTPDGGYIPRILFLDTNGEVLKANNEKKYKNHKFFYPLIPQVIDGMERALLEFGGEEEETKKEEKETKKKEKENDKSKKGDKDKTDKSDKTSDDKDKKKKEKKEKSKSKEEPKEEKPKKSKEDKETKKKEKSPERKGESSDSKKDSSKKEKGDKSEKKSSGKKDKKKSKDEL